MELNEQSLATPFSTAPRNRRRGFVAITTALVAHRRTALTDRILATLLAGVAGAVNAGGFFAIGKYTSHMTGYLSQVADNIADGHFAIAVAALSAIIAFVIGATLSSLLVIWSRLGRTRHQYALPIMVQGIALLGFAFSGNWGVSLQIVFLCCIMGMQNATITKLSKTRVRTTHVTGMVTDIGIETGRALFWLSSKRVETKPNWQKLATLLQLVSSYLSGGILGAIGFAKVGFLFSVPLAFILLGISVPTLLVVKHKHKTVPLA